MAQQTAQSVTATPGVPHSFAPKPEAVPTGVVPPEQHCITLQSLVTEIILSQTTSC